MTKIYHARNINEKISSQLINQVKLFPFLRAHFSLATADGDGKILCDDGYSFNLEGSVVGLVTRGASGVTVGCTRFNGTSHYLVQPATINNNQDLGILGTESYVYSARRGLTLGCWFYPTIVDATARHLVGKFTTTGNQRSYVLRIISTNKLAFSLSADGTSTLTTVTSDVTISTNQWYFAVGQFTPSTEMRLFLNGTWYSNTTSIPASIFDSTAKFTVGAGNDGTNNFFGGDIRNVFVCAGQFSQSVIEDYYNNVKSFFGL